MNKLFSFLAILPALVMGCTQQTQTEKDTFSTVDAEELFFKNVRQSDYKLQEIKDAGMNIFLHNNVSEDDPFIIKLIQNWREDKAYVMLEWNSIEGPISLHSSNGQNITWTGASIDNHLKVATFIFENIQQETQLFLDGQLSIPLIVPDYFIITMKDFQKLTSNK